MRSTIAIHTLTLTIAIVAVVFAVWPGVGDAPWEEDVVVVEPVDRTAKLRCEGALSFRDEAVSALGFASDRFRARDVRDEIAKAEGEIDRYC